MPDAHPPHPPLYFRVGITGTRERQAAGAARPAVAKILSLVKDEILRLARREEARAVYHLEGNNAIHPKFVFVSPLAEGTDRVAAEEALKLGYLLKAPLPFAKEEYENDFPDSLDEFRWLLGRADNVVMLDGARGNYEERSYETVGRFVVNNSDLLIAVWDGQPAKGRGGTGDIVEFAVDLGVPVVNVPIDKGGEFRLTETRLQLGGDTAEIEDMAVDLVVGVGESRLIQTWLQLHLPDRRPYEDGLHLLIKRIVLPPLASQRWKLDLRRSTLQKYWREKVPDAPHEDTTEDWWTESYKPADLLSSRYGAWYRFTYGTILCLAFLALSLAGLSLAYPMKISEMKIFSSLRILESLLVFPSLEFFFLVIIFVLWACDWRFHWHKRWISYRLLAELCRKQRALAPLGRSLPRWEIEHLGGEEIEHLGSEADTRDEAWVGWYFTAMTRAAPFPRGVLRGAALDRARQAGLALLDEQIEYHVKRERQNEACDSRLRNFGWPLFLVTLACVSLEVFCEKSGGPMWTLGLHAASVILPAAAAFVFGFRAYAEPELLADQSARMADVLRDAREELEEAGFGWPLASQDLGARILRAAVLMMQDIRGWAQLFRLKHVETH